MINGGALANLVGVSNQRLFSFGLMAMMMEAFIVIPMALIQSRIEALVFVVVSIGMLVTRVGLILVSLVVFDLGIWGVLGSTAVTSIFFGTVLTVRELMVGSLRIDWQGLPKLLRFVLPFLPNGVLGFIMLSSDRFILNSWAGPEELGNYALAAKLASVVGIVSATPICRVWYPLMYDAAKKDNAPEVFGAMYLRILFAYVISAVGLCLFAPELLIVMGGEAYYPAIALIPIVVSANFFLTAAGLLDTAFYIKRRTVLKPWITLAGAILTVTFLVWLVPMYGATGAAMATTAAFFIYWLVTLAISQKVHFIRLNWTRLALLSVSAAVTVVVAKYLHFNDSVNAMLKVGVMMAWLGTIWLCRVIPHQDKSALRDVAKKSWRLVRTTIGKSAFGRIG